MILSDTEIVERCEQEKMIEPYFKDTVNKDSNGNKVLSYGVSSYGYDIRAADKWYVFNPIGCLNKGVNVGCEIIDPKQFDENLYTEVEGNGYVVIPPNGFVLAHSMEYIKMPKDIVAVVQGKSTLARCGIGTMVTPLEPGWEGHITLEFFNATPLPAKLYAGEGCCQILFFKGNMPLNDYTKRSGKYQGQVGITLPKM